MIRGFSRPTDGHAEPIRCPIPISGEFLLGSRQPLPVCCAEAPGLIPEERAIPLLDSQGTEAMIPLKSRTHAAILSAVSFTLLLLIGGPPLHAQADRKAEANTRQGRVFRAGASMSN